MDLENCVKLIPKRISKVESFLRKNLPQVDSTCARYYEVCVVENKGALLLRYVVLTDESIIITQNPPKTIIQTIKFSQVQDIALVADRGTLIKGGNNNSYICQHVRVVYKEIGKPKQPLENTTNGISVGTSGESTSDEVDLTSRANEQNVGNGCDISSRLSSVAESSLSGSISMSTEDKSLLTILAGQETISSDYDYPFLPAAIRRIYEPILFTKFEAESSSRATSTTGFLDVSFNHSDDSGLSSGSITSENQQHKQFDNEKRDKWTNGSVGTKDKDSRVIRRNRRNRRSKLAVEDKDLEEESFSNFDSSSGSISIRDHPKENDVSPARRANSVLEQRPLSWTPDDRDIDEEGERKRRTRSIDNSQLSAFRKKLFGKYLSGGSNGKSNSHNNINNSKDFTPQTQEKEVDQPKAQAKKLAELNIYLYRPDSLILNELFLLWNRHVLKCSLEMDESGWGQQSNCSLRAAEKILTKANVRDGISLLSTAHTSFRKFSVLLHPLWTLHKNLLRYQHLKLICWKNLNLIGGLLDILKHCTKSGGDGTADDATVDEETQSRFLEKLSAFAITMDIFRLLYQSCSTSFFVQSTNTNFFLSVNRGKDSRKEIVGTSLLMTVGRKLLDTTFSFSSLFAESGPTATDKTQYVIFHPQTFAKAHWLNSSQSKAIKLITIAHNASVSTLFEIISLLHFSPRDNDKNSFMSYIQTFPTDCYLRQSVTQVINLLSSNRPPMKSAQCVLLYQHVSVLKTLLDNLDSVKSFLRITFCEEFQYFVHGRTASVKIPDRYPIKPKLLLICIELRNEIVHKVPT